MKTDHCWYWLGKLHEGYGSYGGMGVHRYSWELHHKRKLPRGAKHHLRHMCHTKSCVNPSHLKSGTAKQNYHDSLKKRKMLYARKKAWYRQWMDRGKYFTNTAVKKMTFEKFLKIPKKRLTRKYGGVFGF